jgi:hypothetical protein
MKENILLELVKKEIQELKARMNELKDIERELESKASGTTATKKKRGPREGSETAKAMTDVTLILTTANEDGLSPTQIHEEAKRKGFDLKPPLIRQILSRNSDLFESPKRGFWRLRNSNTEGEPRKVSKLF